MRDERPGGQERNARDGRACRGVHEEVVSGRDDHEQHERRIGEPARRTIRLCLLEVWSGHDGLVDPLDPGARLDEQRCNDGSDDRHDGKDPEGDRETVC